MTKAKYSKQLRAVLVIVNASDELTRKMLPHIDILNEEIEWQRILEQDLSSGTFGAVAWVQSLWIGESTEDLIGLSYSLDHKTKEAVIAALEILWDLE